MKLRVVDHAASRVTEHPGSDIEDLWALVREAHAVGLEGRTECRPTAWARARAEMVDPDGGRAVTLVLLDGRR